MGDGQNLQSILHDYGSSNLNNLFKKKQISKIDFVFMIYLNVEGINRIHFRSIDHLDWVKCNKQYNRNEIEKLNKEKQELEQKSSELENHNCTIKIGDFGISKLMSSGEQMTQGRGTFHFMAPEILN